VSLFGSFLSVGVVVLGVGLSSALASGPEPRAEVRALLERQQNAWNRHDLDGFMAGYWKSEELTFYSGGSVTRGWQPTLDRYRQRYQSEGSEMGKLEFRNLRIEMLGSDAAFVRGEYHLTMSKGETPSGKTPHGIFTLIVRHLPEGWRVVHDHTSAVE
jgi:ketosteroid isomerase-like protein